MKLILATSLLFSFTLNAQASSFITCDVSVRILAKGRVKTTFKVNHVKQGNSGFGDCEVTKGQVFEVKVEGAEKTTPGSSAIINYKNYSAMGETGPVGDTTWTLK